MSRPSPSPSSSGVAGPSGSVSSLSLSAAEVAHEDEHSDHDDDEHEQTQTNTQTATGTGTTGTNAPVTSRKPRPSVNINSHIHANAFQSKLSFWRSGAAAAAAATKATGTGSGTSSLPSSASASGSLNRQQSVQSHAQTPTHTQSHATPTNTHTHAASPEPPSDTNTEEKEKEPGTHKRRYSAPHQEITDLLQFWKSQEKKKASDRAREQAINVRTESKADTPRERPRVQLAAAVAMAREAERKAQLAAQELAEAKQRVARSQTAHVTIQPGRAIPTSMQAKERERLFQEHQAKLQKEAEEKQKAERDAKIKQEAEKQLFPHKKALEIIPNIQTVQQDSARKKQEEEEKRKREEAEREAKEAKDKIEAEKRAEQKRIAQAQAQAQAEAEAQRQKEQAQAEAEAAAKKQQEEAAKKAQEDAAKAKAEAQAAAERQAQEAAAAAVAATTAVTSTIASTPADEEIIPPTPLLTRLVTDFAQPQAQAQAQPSETSTSASASTSTSSSTSTSTSSVPSTVPVRGPVASRGSVASRPSTTPLVVSENDTSMLSNGPASRSTSVVSDGYDTDSSSDVEARLRTALTSAASTTASSGLSSGSTDFSTTNNSASILGTLRLHSIVERSNSISSQGSQSSISHASFPSAPHTLTPEEIEEIVQKEQRDAEQRQNVLVEVYKSEESYVNNLELLVAEFIHPLKSAQSNIEITQQQVSLMFSNVELLANFHRVFLADLTKSASVADVILKYADFLKMYTQYLNSYSTSLHTIDACRKNAKFVQFLAEKRKKCGLDLMSYLIMPVQRIPRYELLLRELIKYTPANHADLPRLHEAFSKIQNIASHVNEEKRQVENMSKLLEIQNSISGDFGTLLQPHRRLIREGQLMKLSQGILSKLHLRRVYLFSDILLWITTTSKFRGHMELEGAHISEFQEAGKKRFGFKIVTAKKSKEHIFICNSLEESKVWMDDILEARRVLEEAAEKARRRRQDIRKIKQATLKKTLKGGSQMHNMIQASLSSLDLHAGVDESASAAAISPSSRASAAVAVATAAGTGDATTFNFGIGAGTTGAAAGTMSPRAALMRENRTRDLSTVADKPGSNGSPRFVASPSLSSASSPTTSISSSSSVSVSSPTTTTTTTTGSGSYPLSPRSAGMFGHSSLQRDASGAVRTPATMNASEAAAVAAQLRAQQLAAAQALEEAGTPIVETIEDLLIDDDDSRLPGRSVSL